MRARNSGTNSGNFLESTLVLLLPLFVFVHGTVWSVQLFYLHSVFTKLFVADIPTDTASLHVFLLICGLRRVKDPLYLVEVFSGRYLLFEYPCFVPGFRCISFNASKFGISYFIHCITLHHIFTCLKNAHVTIDLFNTLFLSCVFSSLLRITEH